MNPIIRPGDQRTMSLLLLAGLVVVLIACWFQAGGLRWGDARDAEPRRAQFEVDVNQAAWPEIAQLPQIGDVLARRIVTRRDQHGPYRSHEELLEVKGIGPATLKRIRPLLAPMDE